MGLDFGQVRSPEIVPPGTNFLREGLAFIARANYGRNTTGQALPLIQSPLQIPPRDQWSREQNYLHDERLALCLESGVPQERAEELAVSAAFG